MPGREDRLLTIPNILSVIRLLLVPVFVYVLLVEDERYAAAWLLAGLGVSDGVDGYIARHFDQVSNFGKAFDPVADRLLLIVGIGAVLIDGSIPMWVAATALGRELVITVAVAALVVARAKRIDVQWLGKAGTFGLMVSVPLFLVAKSDTGWSGVAGPLAYFVAVPSLLLGWASVITYVPRVRSSLDRAAPASDQTRILR